MAGLVPAIHAFFGDGHKTWMPATSAGMTVQAAIVSYNIGQKTEEPP
jgi:hypothetical protein